MEEQLVWACKNGDLDQVKALVNQLGSDINKPLLGGRNALHFAAEYGQQEVIEFLISKGADVNRPDSHGITALLASIFENQIDSVKLLLKKGADKNGRAPDGMSYYECAETDDIKRLLE